MRGSMSDDPNVPKWALDPLPTETTPLQGTGGGSEGHGAVNGSADDMMDSDISDSDDEVTGERSVRRGWLLETFLALNAITVIVALALAAAQALVLGYHHNLPAESVAVRVYNILFCFLIVCAELEWTQTIREMSVLHSWIPRGILYSFVGVLVLEEDDEKDLDLGVTLIYLTVIAWTMVGIGALYFLMGLCCVKRLRDRKMARHQTLRAHALEERVRRDNDSGP